MASVRARALSSCRGCRAMSICWRCLRAFGWTLRGCRGLSSVGGAMRLTGGLKTHLSQLLERYTALVQKANSPEMQRLSDEDHRKLYKAMSELDPLATLVKQLEAKQQELQELRLLEKDPEMLEIVREEEKQCLTKIEELEVSLVQALVPRDEADEHSAILEVRAGAGGQEASLFAAEIFLMYQKFAVYRRWQFEPLAIGRSDTGGYKHASASLTGEGVFGMMKHESGVHRVQRVPVTEGQGRVHTSTTTVAILPQPPEIEVKLSAHEIKVETFKSTGAGGQSVNTTDSAVRMIHIPTGITVSMQDERSQHKNRAKALKVLRARLYEVQRRAAQEERSEQRKQQIGTGERCEKIRTYNFPQDRVTDHRLGKTVHGVQEFLEGGERLEDLIGELRTLEEAKELARLSREETGT